MGLQLNLKLVLFHDKVLHKKKVFTYDQLAVLFEL